MKSYTKNIYNSITKMLLQSFTFDLNKFTRTALWSFVIIFGNFRSFKLRFNHVLRKLNLSYNSKHIVISLILPLFLLIQENKINAQIWVNNTTTGTPISSAYYLGDKVGASTWNFQYEIGQSSWNDAGAGIGTGVNGTTGWQWVTAYWYQDDGSNKRVQGDK